LPIPPREPPQKPLRAGLVGYGLAGAVFHAPLIAATPGIELAAVVTSNPERRGQAEREHPGVRVLAAADALWDADVDLVVVAAPNIAHVPLARAAVEAGLPVVVDKPLAASASAARELIEAARREGVMLTVFQNRRWDGDFLTVRRLLAEGAFGDVVRFESRFERWRPDVRTDAWREREAPEEAGGLLFDLGSHLIDQALLLFGRPLRVYAEIGRRRQGAAVDDDVFVALEHPGHVRSHLSATMLAALPQARMRVLGTRGTYAKDGLDIQEDALRGGARPGTAEWGREPRGAWGHFATDAGTEPVETVPGAYERFYAGVVDALTTGAPPPVDPADALAGLEVLEAALQSAATGEVVVPKGV
jgi:predicted dehydrogenase